MPCHYKEKKDVYSKAHNSPREKYTNFFEFLEKGLEILSSEIQDLVS